MPILDKGDSPKEDLAPGVGRWRLLDSETGAEALTVADLTLTAESSVQTHIHPTEEAMVILEGELEAVLGDDVITVTAGQTVHAPAGVKHGFSNRSGKSARLLAIFPTARMERTPVD